MDEVSMQSNQKPEHQTAGTIVLQWLTYAFWGWLIVGLIWMLALVLMNFIYEGGSSNVIDMLPYAIAAILVLLPVAFVLDFFYRRREPVKKSGASAIIMVIHAVIFALFGIGVLIASIFVTLNAVINGSFSDGQIVAIFTLLGATLLYAMAFLRTLRPAKLAKLSIIYGISMLVISVGLLVMGVVGPLASSIQTRDDRRIENYLSSVNADIQTYVQDNNEAPTSLGDVRFSEEGAQALVKDDLVTYKSDRAGVSDSYGNTLHNYQLCVTYKAQKGDNDNLNSRGRTNDDQSKLYVINNTHPKGEVCYDLQATHYPREAFKSDLFDLRN